MLDGHRVSAQDDERVLELGGGDVNVIVNVLSTMELYTYK